MAIESKTLESAADSGILTSVKKRKQPPRAEMISELGGLMRESRGFRRSFSPRRSRFYKRPRFRGLFEDPPTKDLSSLLEV